MTSAENIRSTGEALLFRAVALPLKIIPTYFLVYYLVPNFFKKRKYFLFSVYFLFSSIAFTILYRFNNIHVAESIIGLNQPKESLLEIIYQFDYTIPNYFFKIYFYTFLFITVKTFKDRAIKERQLESLQKEKAEAELNFLKAQIHPHFLFNTLNNLYALTLDKSDEAPEVVSKLSDILDYMLYQCKDPKVLVAKEIDLLKHYIDLEKIRYGDRLELNFEHSMDSLDSKIAPLILISLVENAFKHGVSSTWQKAIIKIYLTVEKGVLNFSIFNTKAPCQQSDQMNYKKGIGMKNIRRQLDLVYPKQYEWNHTETVDSYEVNLKIIL